MRNSLRRSSVLFYTAVFAALFVGAGVSASAQTATAGQLVIGEFRLRGPSGANDEFIEIYNASGADHTVTASSGTGYAIVASDGTARCVIPNGTFIQNRGHYLCVNSAAYSLGSYPAGVGATATGDATYTTDIPDNAGIAIFNTSVAANFTLANRLDAVGSTSEANTLYKEGTGYPALTPFSIDYAFYRDTCGKSGSITTFGPCSTAGLPKDTNNNAVDFVFVDTNGTSAGAGQRLGAPGPENLSSPIQRNASFAVDSLDPCVSSTVSPNRVRDFTSAPAQNSTFGTLDIRKTFTNQTGSNVTKLRFRVIDLTTFPAPSGFADLRPRTSPDVVVTVDRAPCGSGTSNVTVSGTSLDQPPSQPNGGGFNTSLTDGTITLGTPLPNGASFDVRFLLGIQQTGSFKFFVNIEAVTASLAAPPASDAESSAQPLNKLRRLISESQSPTGGLEAAPQSQPQPASQAQGVTPQAQRPVWTVLQLNPEPEKQPASKKKRARKGKDAKDASEQEPRQDEDGTQEETPAAPPA